MPVSGSTRGSARRRLNSTRARQVTINLTATGGYDSRPSAKGSTGTQIASAMTALTAACALLISGLSLKVTREGQITGRYGSAVEQLGSRSLDTRIGAIYALGRLALDSKYDRPVVIDLLTDYVRERAVKDVKPPLDPATACRLGDVTPSDVIAALRVLFYKLAGHRGGYDVDLDGACLKAVDFRGSDLSCLILDNATIWASDFERAIFVDASLQGAHLNGSVFTGANFTRAVAAGADLGDTSTPSPAGMEGAIFRDADFTGAKIVNVELSRADLTNTRLDYADLSDSNVHGATLRTYLGDVKNLPPEADRTAALSAPPSLPPHRCQN